MTEQFKADPNNPGWCLGCNPDNCEGCRPAVPTERGGWRWAPMEPTHEMLCAAFDLFEIKRPPGHAARTAIYQAMLAAAPQPASTTPTVDDLIRQNKHLATCVAFLIEGCVNPSKAQDALYNWDQNRGKAP